MEKMFGTVFKISLGKLSAQGNELWAQSLKYVDYANKLISPGKWAVNPAIEIMLIMLIKLPAQGNELWTQPLKYVDYANNLPS